MKKIISAISIVLLLSAFGMATACPTGAAMSWSQIISAQTGMSASITNFPFQFTGNPKLKSTVNGGKVQDSVTAKDVWFCSGTTLLPYLLIPGSYNPSTGAGLWDVQAPTVSNTAGQTITGYAGLVSPTDQSCGPSGYNNCAATLYSGYLMVYHFIGGSLYNAVDGTTGTNHGAVANTSGPLGAGLTFTGSSSQWADTGETQTSITNYTEEAWLDQTTYTTQFAASSRNSGPTGGTFICVSCSGPAESGDIGYSNGSNYYFQATTSSLGLFGVYGYVVGTHTAGSANMTSYYNGAPQTTGYVGNSGSPTNPANSSTTKQFGRDGANSTPNYFTGVFAEYRFSNTVLSANWILSTYNAVSNPSAFSTFSCSTGCGSTGTLITGLTKIR